MTVVDWRMLAATAVVLFSFVGAFALEGMWFFAGLAFVNMSMYCFLAYRGKRQWDKMKNIPTADLFDFLDKIEGRLP